MLRFFFITVTVNPTASVNGRNEMRNADESWKSAGKRRRRRSSGGYARERRKKRRRRKKTKIRAKKGATVTAAVAQMKV